MPRPDIAIYVEPTQLNIYAAQMGFLICEIAVTGRSAYFGVPELGVDALKASHAILSALFAHSADARGAGAACARRPSLPARHRARGRRATSRCPGECRISLIRKLHARRKPRCRPSPSSKPRFAARRSIPRISHRLRLSGRPRSSIRRHADARSIAEPARSCVCWPRR